MTNPFDDLGSGTDESSVETNDNPGSEANADRSTETDDPESELSSIEPGESVDSQPSTRTVSETDLEQPAADSGPAFEYSAVRQKPLYARDETWTEFEKTFRTSIAPALAAQDVIDEETREIHDAVLRLANQEPERIAELVLEARREP